jgi:hypothetical protein
MTIEKENFLRSGLVSHLQRLDPGAAPLWGKMNVQQMIEHFALDALRNANGALVFEKIVTPPEKLVRFREFLMSEKPFKENTLNPLMGETPAPVKYNTIQAAIGALQEELIHFFEVFEKEPQRIIRNPIFGDLTFEQNVQLLYKHALHHLRQFGVDIV